MNDCQNIFTEHRMKLAVDFNRPITIVPFGDVHRDSHQHDAHRWQAFLKKCKANDTDQTYYLLMGDELDFMSSSERKAIRDLHESTLSTFDDVMSARVWQLAEELKFMKGRMIGCLAGNHCHRMCNGKWSTELLCKEMGCAFLGYSSYIRLSLSNGRTKNAVGACIDIFASHGRGGGRLLGSSYNTVEKMRDVFNSADIYLMGHDHTRGGLCDTTLYYDSHFTMRERQQWFCRTGSFLRGWEPGVESYVAGRMYSPTDLGAVRFDVRITRNQKGINRNGGRSDRMQKEITFIS